MSTIFQTNAPERFPAPKEQPLFPSESEDHGNLIDLPVKEKVGRWKNDIIDKIQYLRENLDLANQEKEGLFLEVDRLQSELTFSKGRIQELESQLSDAMETFNTLLREVSQALET